MHRRCSGIIQECYSPRRNDAGIGKSTEIEHVFRRDTNAFLPGPRGDWLPIGISSTNNRRLPPPRRAVRSRPRLPQPFAGEIGPAIIR